MRARLRPPFLPHSDTVSSPSSGDGQDLSPASSSLPPTLPPIASSNIDIDVDLQRHVDAMSSQSENRPPQSVQRSPYTGSAEPGFIGGVALRNYRRDLQAQAEAQAQAHAQAQAQAQSKAQGQSQQQSQTHSSFKHDASDNIGSLPRPPSSPSMRNRPVPTPIDTNVVYRPSPQIVPQPYKSTSSFVAPTDLQNAASHSATGRRPAGVRLQTEPPSFPSNAPSVEPQKTKKSLPFLRNPMSSLLMRRKNSQNAPDPAPLPLKNVDTETFHDPRIRGTRIHDFSAPRKREPVIKGDGPPTGVVPQASHTQDPEASFSPVPEKAPEKTERVIGDYSATAHNPDDNSANSMHRGSSIQASQHRASSDDRSSFISRASFAQRRRPLSHRLDSTSSMGSESTKVSRASDTTLSSPPRPTNSTKTKGSRPVSLSSEISARAIPRHMKSTSSRFSFDMIGAANEEKILEERHRQREAEKREAEAANPRNSGYDDYDDEFDYDAMMDDDGLEERIPGVNADFDDEGDQYYGEEDADPDDDQENFAGFVFQRSNVSTAMPTPQSAHLLQTPRDAEGNVIGYAKTQGSPFIEDSTASPALGQTMTEVQGASSLSAGLGIQNLGLQESYGSSHDDYRDGTAPLPLEPKPSRGAVADEDLYFDDGIVGYEDEFADELASIPDGEPFDESLFDNNDTDQYGRPIAGAFAHAQAQAYAHGHIDRQEPTDAEGLSNYDSSTATQDSGTAAAAELHATSASTDQPTERGTGANLDETGEDAQHPMLAYQAALAEAAHKAAASGKFRWDSSPGGHGNPDDSSHSPDDDNPGHGSADWDDGGDFGYENMDDFEYDDEAIIAEANASALANDSDGWYGQEFGFYSAPANQYHGSRGDNSSSTTGNYQYSNGGFFGPKGMSGLDRSTSGRVVSREPNLTPITERSEYSNRNSLMSLAVPGQGFGTPIQSPGLAQLAMMADHGADDISLSGLLRLRSKAWGTSQASLSSSREGSPKSDRGELPSAPWSPNSVSSPYALSRHGRSASAVSNNMNWELANMDRPLMLQDLSSSAPAADSFAIPREDSWTGPSAGGPANRVSLSAVGTVQPHWGREPEYAVGPERRGHRRQNSGDSMSQLRQEGY